MGSANPSHNTISTGSRASARTPTVQDLEKINFSRERAYSPSHGGRVAGASAFGGAARPSVVRDRSGDGDRKSVV